ncbi:site-2 protease family protein [Candidatus Saccharibacteria bacterium TM7i]|nr:site-2 protease family protein [Candidatus Saccharibacteria bacterium TM7i]
MLLVGIIIGLIVLVILVALHELGHALAARRHGVVVEEFGIGMPPRAWKKKLKNGVLLTLNWLPIGGFVKLQGEHDSANKKGDYGAATFWQKTQILLAGVVVNWLIAVLLLTALAWVGGLPKIIPNQFAVTSDASYVRTPVEILALKDDYPAAKAGLQKGDVVTKINGVPVETVQDLIKESSTHRGEATQVAYERGGKEGVATVRFRDEDKEVFGAQLGQSEKLRATWSAPIVGVVTTGQYTWATLQGLGNLVADTVTGLFGQLTANSDARQAASEKLGRAGDSVAGPVGILGTIFPNASKAGPEQVVFLAAIISLTLAVMNILPIPALDGGRWFVTAMFKLFKKPLTKEREETIHGVGFMVLLGLILLITILDISKLFR